MTLVLLGGCSAFEPAPPAPSILREDQFSARNLGDKGLHASLKEAGVDGGVWGFKSLYWTALYFNPDLAESKAQVGVSEAATITAGQQPNPVFSFSPSFDNSTIPSAWLLGVGLSVPIETGSKRELRQAVAQEQVSSAQAQFIGKAWDVRSGVLNSLIDLHVAREALTRDSTLIGVQKSITYHYDKRRLQGQIPSVLASQAQINYQQSLVQLEQAKTDEKLAQVSLAGALGIPVASLQHVSIDDTIPQIDKTHLPSRKEILQQHPALLAALADYRAAHQALQLEVAKRTPDIDIGPGYEWNSQQGGKISLGLSLTLPIANQNEGPIAEANAKRLVAAKHVESVQAMLISQIEQAEAACAAAAREREAAQKMVVLQHAKEARLQSMITRQNTASLPLLYAKSETQAASLAELAAYIKFLKAEAALENATRQPLFGAVIDETILLRGTR